jgi:hypothetical protein
MRQLRRAAATGCGGWRSRRQDHQWSARSYLGQRSRVPMIAGWRALVADDGAKDDRAHSGAGCGRENHAARRRRSKRADRTPDDPSAPDRKCQEQEQECRCPRAGPAYLAVQVRKREDDPAADGASRDAQDGSDLAVRPPLEIGHVQHLPLAFGERSKACLNRVAAKCGEQAIPDAGLDRHSTPILGQKSSCFGVAPKPPSRVGWRLPCSSRTYTRFGRHVSKGHPRISLGRQALVRALTFRLDHPAHRDLTVVARLPRRNREFIAPSPGFPSPAESPPPPTQSACAVPAAASCSSGKCGRCRHRSAPRSLDTHWVEPAE